MNITAVQNYNYTPRTNQNPSFGCFKLPTRRVKKFSDVDKLVNRMARDSEPKEQPLHWAFDGRTKYFTDSTKDGKTLLFQIFFGMVPSGKYCLFFHGGTSTASNYQSLYAALMDKNINIIPMDYAGYGTNKSIEANYKNLMDSSEVVYKFLTEKFWVKPEHISILGYCMGGQVAANLASKVKCHSLFLINPMTHVSDLSKGYLASKDYQAGFFARFLDKMSQINPIVKYKFTKRMNSYYNADKINCPVYVLSSKDDKIMNTKKIDAFVERLRELGKEVWYERDFGEGHKLTKDKIDYITSEMQDRLETDTNFLLWKHFGIPYPRSPLDPFA